MRRPPILAYAFISRRPCSALVRAPGLMDFMYYETFSPTTRVAPGLTECFIQAEEFSRLIWDVICGHRAGMSVSEKVVFVVSEDVANRFRLERWTSALR